MNNRSVMSDIVLVMLGVLLGMFWMTATGEGDTTLPTIGFWAVMLLIGGSLWWNS